MSQPGGQPGGWLVAASHVSVAGGIRGRRGDADNGPIDGWKERNSMASISTILGSFAPAVEHVSKFWLVWVESDGDWSAWDLRAL